MNEKENIAREIRKTLEQFDHAEQLPHDPFFYARVQSRLTRQRRQSIFSGVLRPALLLLFVFINVGTAIWYFHAKEQLSKKNVRQELFQILASDFKLSADDNALFFNE